MRIDVRLCRGGDQSGVERERMNGSCAHGSASAVTALTCMSGLANCAKMVWIC